MTRTYAVGNFNTAHRLDDHTGPWVDIAPVGGAIDWFWRDVMADPTNPDKVVIVGSSSAGGNNNSIRVSSDAGVTWNTPTGDWTDACDFFHEVWYVDANIIWAINSNGLVVLSLDGGASFNLTTQFGRSVPGDYSWTAAIHAINTVPGSVDPADQVAVVLGSKSSSLSEQLTFAWKTTDGGATWNLLNGAQPLPNNLIDPTSGQPYGTGGVAQGIWISPDEQKIVTGTGYAHHTSLDAGASFTSIGQDIHRSGNHLTWFPSYDPNPQYFHHTGGSIISVVTSNDSALSWVNMRSYESGGGGFGIVPLTNLPIQILGCHFYSPQNGYYGYHDNGVAYIDSTSNGAVDGTISHTNPTLGASYEAIWTSVEPGPPFEPCFELTDCAGILPSIFTQSDLSAHDGQVITLADDTNHEIEGCWLVTATTVSCPDSPEIAVYKCYEDCETCLPPVQPPEVPCPRPVDPGYNTGLCDPSIVEAALCSFSEMIYQQMMSKRYKIEYCCLPDEENILIRFEKIQMKLRESESLAPDPCNPKCYSYEIGIDVTDSAVTTYIDCFEVEQTIVTPIGTLEELLPRLIEFCALDTSVPTSIVTHPDTTTDTYLVPRLEECSPPIPPIPPCTCSTYTGAVNNGAPGVIPYIDCDGIATEYVYPGSEGEWDPFTFCGQSGQTLLPSAAKGFEYQETECCGDAPICISSELTFPAGLPGGVYSWLDCDGVAQAVTYPFVGSEYTEEICAQEGTLFTDGPTIVQGEDC